MLSVLSVSDPFAPWSRDDFLRGREPYNYAWGATDRPPRRPRLTRRA